MEGRRNRAGSDLGVLWNTLQGHGDPFGISGILMIFILVYFCYVYIILIIYTSINTRT